MGGFATLHYGNILPWLQQILIIAFFGSAIGTGLFCLALADDIRSPGDGPDSDEVSTEGERGEEYRGTVRWWETGQQDLREMEQEIEGEAEEKEEEQDVESETPSTQLEPSDTITTHAAAWRLKRAFKEAAASKMPSEDSAREELVGPTQQYKPVIE